MVNYWLYTEEYPDEAITDGTWGIFVVDVVDGYSDEADDDVDQAKIKEIIYDDTGYMSVGDQDDIFDDSVTQDPHRVLQFLFEQRFW